MKILKVLSIFLMIGIMIQCKKEKNNDFVITKDKIGKLDRASLARDIDLIYAEDSVVIDTVKLNFRNGAGKIRIYESGGVHLLTLTPNTDSIPTIQNVQMHDHRFIASNRITKNSTFKDINDVFEVKKIITSLNNIIVILRQNDLYFTIDKKELPANLRYTTTTQIEAVQIPDSAKVKYMMVSWD